MMASASSSNNVVVTAAEDDVDHRVSRGTSMTTDVINHDDSLRQLEEGHCIQKLESNQLSHAKNNNVNQHLISEEEAVALQAFNKACGEQSRSSSFCSGIRSNTPSRTSFASSTSASALPVQNGINNHIDHNVSTHTKIKLDTAPKKSTQYAPDNNHNSTNMDDLNISLNSDDLRNPGGFDGSMSISDLLMGSSKVGKTHHFDSHGSSGYSFNSNGSNHDNRNYPEGSNNGSSNSEKLKMGNNSISIAGSSTESRNNKFVSSITGLLRPISKRRREKKHDEQRNSSGNNSKLDRSSSNNNWKDSSAISMNSYNSKDTNNGSILNPSKKKHSRVSWQIIGEDLDQSSNADAVAGNTHFIDSNNNNTTPKESTRRRGSSWSIADLERMHCDSPSVAGDPSSVSIKSALTPEEQQLWTSMLQLANLSTNLNEGSGENDGNKLGASAGSLGNEISIQDMMHLASETMLQSSAVWEGNERDAIERPLIGDNNEAGSSREVQSPDTPREELSSSPPQSHQTESPIEITPATAVAVTRLAYQEVEEYSARLRRKRAEMDRIDGSSSSSSQRQQQQSPAELNDLNTLLLENATNINHAVLLQRALYALRIHRGSLMDDNNVVDTSNNNNVDTTERQTNYLSRSVNSGLDHLALNHLLTLSPSVSSSGINMSGSSRSSGWRIAAQNAAASLRNQPSSSLSSSEGQRRHTDLEPQIGAYHQNEPAPLLFRRTFANPNRRVIREEARRATMDALNGQGMSDENNDESTGSVGQQTPQQLLYQSPNELSNNEGSETAESSPTDDCHDIENSITAQVTAYNPDDTYNRRSLGTLIESNQSQQSHQSASSIMSTPRNALLTAQNSFRRRSLRARQMIQAVLVSDEVVEAVEAEHILCGEGCLHPNDSERMDMMEELLEEKEEEARMIEERYKRREVGWMIVVIMLVIVIGVLIVAVLRKW